MLLACQPIECLFPLFMFVVVVGQISSDTIVENCLFTNSSEGVYDTPSNVPVGCHNGLVV